MNRGGFSWRRLTGVSAAKSRLSRKLGVPLTRSGRQRKLGRMVSSGGCLIALSIGAVLLVTLLALNACGASTAARPTAPSPTIARPTAPSPTAAPAVAPSPTAARTVAPSPTTVPAGPTATHTPAPRTAAAANLRSGPGVNYPIIGGIQPGQALAIIARDPAGDWYQLADGSWIYAALVSTAPTALPTVAVIPPTPAIVPRLAPTARGLPSAAASTCPCDRGDILNCSDLNAWDAQSCYLRCKQLTGRDIHRLDRDNDGNACEWQY